MQIIIPMSGMGNRFVQAGYSRPKPLIEIDGMPIIEHVKNLFPGESNFSFICNAKHLAETDMRETLQRIAPEGKVFEIPPHKLGPVYAVMQIADTIADDEEVIVNYCDFGTYWNYQDFLDHTRSRKADGAVVAYKGFHPHMLGSTNYAFMRDDKQWMLEIKEKEPFTDSRMEEYASNGTYYFRTGSIMKKYFQGLLDSGDDLNGEFYVSMVYNHLLENDLSVSIYDIQHMLQWGTPQDVEEYNVWSRYFSHIATEEREERKSHQGATVIPLAGHGSRFVKEGYSTPKPLIEVSGKPMILQATEALPQTTEYVFCCLAEHLNSYPLEQELKNMYPDCSVVRIDQVTEGQACTIELGLDEIDDDIPIFVGACDNSMVYDRDKFDALIASDDIAAVAFSFRNHPSATQYPQMYGWLRTDTESKITDVSVKVPISDTPANDHAIVGAFYFSKAKHFKLAMSELYKRDQRVNGEFYADSLIGVLAELGHNVHAFEVAHYICWGTPNDLRTYEYWQSFFHKAPWHEYSLNKDPLLDAGKREYYEKRCKAFEQPYR